MHPRTLALVIAATALTAGCLSNEPKPDAATPAPAAKAAEPPPPAKPECPPEPAAKKKTEKTSKKAATKKTEEVPPPDCEPAKPKTAAAAPAKAAEPPPPAKEITTGKACNPCTVKSRDGSFTGEIYGTIPANSKWAKLQIGMQQQEVERILGVTQNIRAYVTAKAFIPFYYGTDSHRYEAVYAGQGSVAYTGGGMGGGQGVLMMINFDPKVQ